MLGMWIGTLLQGTRTSRMACLRLRRVRLEGIMGCFRSGLAAPMKLARPLLPPFRLRMSTAAAYEDTASYEYSGCV